MDLWFLVKYKQLLLRGLKTNVFLFLSIALIGLCSLMLYGRWLSLEKPFSQLSTRTLEIPPGASLQQFVDTAVALGLTTDPFVLKLYCRYQGLERQLRAGDYALVKGMTLRSLLSDIRQGKELQYAFTIVPGMHLAEVLAALAQEKKLVHTKIEGQLFEGQLLPDTYFFTVRSEDAALLKRAHQAFIKTLNQLWARRSALNQLKTPHEAVVLASIVEKESSIASERAQIAGVFQKRLALGMPLQADPTVRYAFSLPKGEPLLKKHLQTDHPYNTYTRKGLPPGPIAFPSKEALEAVVQPQITGALYFVAKGDGSHVFSNTLAEHLLAVKAYRAQRI